jgi:membrane associated rhomboid family serine protease
MQGAPHTIRQEIHGVVLFVGAIWAVFLVSLVFPKLDQFGVVPRHAIGLVGIPAMPFLHLNLQHILSNTVPLFVLLVLLAGSRSESWEVVLCITLLGGLLLWIFGREAVHIGASGLISGLTAFLIFSGILEKRFIPLLVALLVGFLYGSSVLMGVIPHFGSQVSWDGHLCGAIAGGIVAYALTRAPRQPSQVTLAGSESDRLAL